MSETIKLRDPRKTKELELPSFPGSKVEVYASLLLNQSVDIDPNLSSEKKGLALLPRFIKSWNLSDEEGKLLEINTENVGKLPNEDAVFLYEEIGKFVEEQKKI